MPDDRIPRAPFPACSCGNLLVYSQRAKGSKVCGPCERRANGASTPADIARRATEAEPGETVADFDARCAAASRRDNVLLPPDPGGAFTVTLTIDAGLLDDQIRTLELTTDGEYLLRPDDHENIDGVLRLLRTLRKKLQ